MKKLASLLLSVILMVSLASCKGSVQDSRGESSSPDSRPGSLEGASGEEPGEPDPGSSQAGKTKSLVVYFSWSGNTEMAAQEIQRQTGAELFQIVPAQPYTEDYNALLDIARQEQKANARPEIAGSVENFEEFDVIYLGYPIWHGDMPRILYSFLDAYDCSGKTIAPFVTSGGSGLSGTVSTIQELEPGAAVSGGLSLGSSQVADSAWGLADEVEKWLDANGLQER